MSIFKAAAVVHSDTSLSIEEVPIVTGTPLSTLGWALADVSDSRTCNGANLRTDIIVTVCWTCHCWNNKDTGLCINDRKKDTGLYIKPLFLHMWLKDIL